MKTGYTGLAVPGPTNMPFQVRKAMDVALEDHRAPDFPAFTKPLFEDLKKIFKTETGRVFVYPCSGTGGWEAAITNTLSEGDTVLASVFGQFSLLWVDLCQRFGLKVDAIDVEWGKGVPLDDYRAKLSTDKDHRIKAVLVTHNETATGVTSDVAGVRRILDDLGHPALLFVDGVSSIASIDFRMDEWGVDVVVSGSQKGFMMPTGLAILGVSQKALGMADGAGLRRCFFDFRDMVKTNDQGYFPYTPAATLLHGLRASVDMLLEEGLENVFARHHRLASGVRAAVEAWGLKNCAKGPEWYSDTVTAIVAPEGFDANAVIKTAYDRYNLSLGAGLNKVAGKVFRIGHLGWLNEIMVLQALGGVEMAMRDVGIPFQAGAGVGAAVEHFTDTRAGVRMAAE
ncbi:aminotransferase class V-fold PLP-dependent enzyme [Silicimonas algicola]|uniref:Serine-glyoxylate aminotransferase n=1 Tax=Silicimonas algicola TaxID=1826607 RepID=A0A316G9W8_9RHOB|nr:aminotransferase class V-fold PLP-dependent enzyme [Silicimonas algicola]AZQ68163.1 aminotransferase class V-fold PLP-dependent enzyme [Silicimonas algicola]PWK57373.1 serine-glyoxylate aminotransferase [Silicimonas algicola]